MGDQDNSKTLPGEKITNGEEISPAGPPMDGHAMNNDGGGEINKGFDGPGYLEVGTTEVIVDGRKSTPGPNSDEEKKSFISQYTYQVSTKIKS